MIDQGDFLEHAIVYEEHKGVPRAQVREALASGRDVVMRLDVQGAETVKGIVPEALLIFITADSEEELIQRLKERSTETPEKLAVRIATARQELKRVEAFDYVIVNHDDRLDHTVDVIRAIIEAEHHRVRQRRVSL
jgi:guanylate kinase